MPLTRRFVSISPWVVLASSLSLLHAAPLTTVQNSPLTVPAASIAASGLPSATNLVGSNFMVSAVVPGTLQGGTVSLLGAQQWVRRYNTAPPRFSGGSAIALRPHGGIVVAGSSQGPSGDNDFVTLAYAPDGRALWTNRYDGPGHNDESAQFITSDSSGNIWVAGSSRRYATNSTLRDVAIVKYGSSGVPIWTNLYSSFETNGAWPTAFTVDGAGNAYVMLSAAYWGSSALGVPVEDVITKYGPAGDVLWSKHYFSAPAPGQDLWTAEAMALDQQGNVFIGGRGWSVPRWGGPTVLKYSGAGTPVWTNISTPGGFFAMDRQGNLLVTGGHWISNTWLSVVVKCSNDGFSLWTNSLTGPYYNGGNVPQTLCDRAGNVFVIGGQAGATNTGLYQILKLRSDGAPLWTNQTVDFGSLDSMIEASATDNAGNLYLTGHAHALGNEHADFVTMKFSAEGRQLWTSRFNGAADREDYPRGMVVDAAGEVYITGYERATDGSHLTTLKYAELLAYRPPLDFTGSDAITYTLTDNFGHSATGSVAVEVAPGAFRFNVSSMKPTAGGLELHVDGAPANGPVVLEASTDLYSWQPVSTNTSVGGSVQFTDPNTAGSSPRFYRAAQAQ